MGQKRTFGTLYRRRGKDGKLAKNWTIRYRYKGRPIQRVVGPSKALAKQALAKIELAIAREDWLEIVEVASLTLAEFLPKLHDILEARHAPGTVVNEKGVLARAAVFFGGKPMKDVESSDVSDFITAMRQERQLSASAVNQYLSTLSTAFKEAIRHKLAKTNPVRDVPRPKVPKRPIRYLGEEELARILGEAVESARPLFRFAYETGLRRGEVTRLTWGDVDLRRRVIVVRESKSKWSREVPVSEMAGEVLEAQFRQRTSVLGEEPVFPVYHRNGHKLSRHFRAAADSAGLPEFRLHDLRHGFGSRLAQAGVPLTTVMELMGHATVQMTLRYAGHLPQDAKRQAIARADAVRRPRPESAAGSA